MEKKTRNGKRQFECINTYIHKYSRTFEGVCDCGAGTEQRNDRVGRNWNVKRRFHYYYYSTRLCQTTSRKFVFFLHFPWDRFRFSRPKLRHDVTDNTNKQDWPLTSEWVLLPKPTWLDLNCSWLDINLLLNLFVVEVFVNINSRRFAVNVFPLLWRYWSNKPIYFHFFSLTCKCWSENEFDTLKTNTDYAAVYTGAKTSRFHINCSNVYRSTKTSTSEKPKTESVRFGSIVFRCLNYRKLRTEKKKKS